MTIGVLALQGDFADHITILQSLGVDVRPVRQPADLRACSGLILPGGESTSIALLLRTSGLRSVLCDRVRDGSLAVFGTCAGAILLAQKAEGLPPAEPLGLLDIDIRRNAYGTQLQSFEADLPLAQEHVPVSFIRAPLITRVGPDVTVEAAWQDTPVLVRHHRMLAATFHAEVHGADAVHRMFLAMLP